MDVRVSGRSPNGVRPRIDKMTIDTRWFQDRLADKDMSQRGLARLMGLDPAAVSYMFRGKRRIQLDEAAKMARVLGLPLDEVLKHSGVQPEKGPETTAVVGVLSGDMELVMGPAPGPKRADLPPESPPNTVAVRVVAPDGPLGAYDGAVVFFAPSDGISADAVGRLAMVKLKDGRAYLRVIRKGYSQGRYRLLSLWGHGVIEDAQVVSACPVVWMKF